MRDDIKEQVKGRWRGIMAELGISTGKGEHTSCPICGPGNNRHRFRFDDKGGDGTWICTHCGAGDGWSLVMKVLNFDFKRAVEMIRSIVGSVEPHTAEQPKADPEAMKKLYKISRPIRKGDLAYQYLVGRGLSGMSENVKLGFCPKCYEHQTKKEHPAMLATFSDPEGNPITIHRTYLTDDARKLNIESPKKFLPSSGAKLTGGAVRLFEYKSGPLCIAEGIETAIAVSIVNQMPVWAAIGTSLLEAFQPPENITKLEIYSDNDESYAGQKAAYTLANKVSILRGIPVEVHVPLKPGTDFLDELKEEI